MTYPFGYGLSYTTFEEHIRSFTPKKNGHDYTVDVQVEVKNVGTEDGSDVVEVYGSAPYNGTLEKSAIQLLDFEKTKVLKPQESETLHINVDLQNLATYDMNHVHDGVKGGYVLEKGTHYFALGNGAHEALNNVLKYKGFDVDGENSSDKVRTIEIANDDYDTFSISKTNTLVSNQLEYSDLNYYEPNTVTYLSRRDWVSTWPKEYKDISANDALLSDLKAENPEHYYHINNDNTEEVTWGKDSGAKLASMFQAEWDDERWDDILDQVTLEEAVLSIMYGGPTLAGAPSIGFEAGLYLTENSGSGVADIPLASTKDPSAPWAIKETDHNAAWVGGVFANAPTTAASFNKPLWDEEGEFIGTEALFTGISFLWGPGLNTHRTSYNGRTGEYYSEDGILAGMVAREYAAGALKKGLIASPKHFAFNDQETNRAGIAPFMTEQRARETELRAYQIAVEGGMCGLMTSFSKIGGVEVTSSYGLMTNILQNEWGFHGYAVTDIYDDTDLFASVAGSGVVCFDLRGQQPSAGVGNALFKSQQQGYTHAVDTYAHDSVLQKRMKLALKNMLWVSAQSSLMNRFNENSHTVQLLSSWRAFYIFGGSIFAALTLGSLIWFVVLDIKERKE